MKRASLDLLAAKVEIELEYDPLATRCCPECGKECYRHYNVDMTWRHLDVMQFTTLMRARVPRTRCPEHGVKTMPV